MAAEKRHLLLRLVSLGVLFFAVCFFYLITLVNYQIAGQDYYTMSNGTALTTRTVRIAAQRGQIYDRNGVALVTNTYSHSVRLDAGSMPASNADKNALLLFLAGRGREFFTTPALPFTWTVQGEDIFFEYDEDFLQTVYGRRYVKLMDGITEGAEISATNAAFRLFLRYGICEDDFQTMNYSTEDALLLLAVRLDMETHNFSSAEPYTILNGVDMTFLTEMREQGYRGVSVVKNAVRVYEVPGVASHILGRVGKIQSQYVDYYTEKGYSMNAVVGISGAEYAFEDYLRGIDGEMVITEDAYGNILDSVVTREPVAGCDVYLTIDIALQKTAEKALEDNIDLIVTKALESSDQLVGEDADAGALTMLDAKTGEILALASYPSYDLSTFSRDYERLNNDATLPMLNRALYGQYPPGSVFKPGIAAAALMEGVITPNTQIECTGLYHYYEDAKFTPACWIYTAQYRWRNHGKITVTKAIQESCNIFFYDVGRQLGIDRMNRYCRIYGFGQHTGIELGESTGVLAGPDYRESVGGESWSPGDTCTAAIGQSDNLVTPLQLSVYISTIINYGERLRATILKEVRSYTGEVVYSARPEIVDSITISSNTRSLILNAMKNVTENGSAARVFRDFPIVVGGKTGTAQRLQTESAFASFIAFAPFDDPEIVVSCIIERGAAGTDAGYAVRDVFDAYFGVAEEVPPAH